MTLTKSAIAAFKKQRASREEQEVETAKSVAADFEERFGTYVALTDFDLQNARFTLEGMTFRYERGWVNGWWYSLLWFCPVCGEVSRHAYVRTLAELGRWLTPNEDWKLLCPGCAPKPEEDAVRIKYQGGPQ